MSLNRDKLAQHGLYYPETFHPLFQSDHQHRFVFASIINEFNAHGLLVENFDFTIIDALAEEMLRNGQPKNLISEENLSWHPKLQSAALARFSKWFDVKIIVFLRRQDQWLESNFTQLVRGGYDGTIASILDDIRTPDRLDFLEFLGYWADHFGIQNLIVKRYLEDGKNSENLLLGVLGLPSVGWLSAPRRNDSLSLYGVRFHRALVRHELNFDYGAFNELFDQAILDSTPGQSARYFSIEERMAFLERFTSINRDAASKYAITMETSSDLFAFDANAHPTQSDDIDVMPDSEFEVIMKRLVRNIRIRNRSSLDIWKAMLVAACGCVVTRDVVAK